MKYILALDQGTSSSRAVIFDHELSVVAECQEELNLIYPQQAWVEIDPYEILNTQFRVGSNALESCGAIGTDIAGLGIANQRETTVIWNRETGEPIYNAIAWQDRRTSAFCSQIKDQGLSETIKSKTGLIIDPYFSATKINWLLTNVPGAQKDAESGLLAFGCVDSWLLWNLTDGNIHATDVTNASRTMLFNIHTGDWDSDLLEIFQVPRQLLPDVKPSSYIFAHSQKEILGASVPISGIAGDQQAALFGQSCTRPGLVKATYGTGAFVLMYTGATPVTSTKGCLTTVSCQLTDQLTYALEGSVFTAGSVIQWLRDQLGFIDSSQEVELLANTVPDSDGVYLVPAFTGLGTPHWDPYARGLIIGLTSTTNRGHIARAALDSIAYQTADVVQTMVEESGLPISDIRVDGGASSNNLLMQIQSDIMMAALSRPRITETTALGAAGLAGLSVGYWKHLIELEDLKTTERTFIPRLDPDAVAQVRDRWDQAVERSKGWAEI